jgi:hypothetical protein
MMLGRAAVGAEQRLEMHPGNQQASREVVGSGLREVSRRGNHPVEPAGQDLPTPTSHVMAIGSRYDRWYASILSPAINLSASPASLSMKVGEMKTSTVTVSTNSAYAPYISPGDPDNFVDDMVFDVTSSSATVIPDLSVDEWNDPGASNCLPVTLTVTALAPQSGPVNVTVTATSDSGVIDSIVVPVTVIFP